MNTKAELERKYGVPVYAKWEHVPSIYKPRSYFTEFGIIIPKSALPDAIKGGGLSSGNSLFFLFSVKKWVMDKPHQITIK